MNTTPENKIRILEYKLAYEQELNVKREFEEGSTDLNYRLSFFRNKITQGDGEKANAQLKIFDSIFMPDDIILDNTEIVNSVDSNTPQVLSKLSANVEPWLKKTYRQIVKLTHPDMIIGVKSKKIRRKFENYYLVAQNAYDKNIAADIIMVASDLDIFVDNDIIESEILKPCQD